MLLRLMAAHLFCCLLKASCDSLVLILLCRFFSFDLCMMALLSFYVTKRRSHRYVLTIISVKILHEYDETSLTVIHIAVSLGHE